MILCAIGCALIVVALVGGGDKPPPPASKAGAAHHSSPSTATSPTPDQSSSATPEKTDSTAGLARSKPVKVEIPDIGVESKLLTLGLESSGAVEVPADNQAEQAGWYRYSPTPGEVGPAVIIGHVDSKTGPAVFYRLGELRRGDTIRVRRADGATAVFTVNRNESFSKKTFPTKEVYGDVGHSGLRLITCAGSYDRENGGYQDNTVVFASLSHVEHSTS